MKKFHLFDVFGVELEYMIVNRDTLAVMPITDQLIAAKLGEIASDVENGSIAWSNELTAHVIEIKTNGPVKSFKGLAADFHANILEINELLAPFNAMLLPTAAHPFMNPFTETVLWQHDNNEVYALYNRIFDCRGHGWSNLQSMHLNLPFANDEEFGRLHAAIRFLLPIIPGLTASSPMLDGQLTASLDARMKTYSTNQAKLPQLMGALIPEAVFTEGDYKKVIFEPIKNAIKPFDEEEIMDEHFLNSRGAIARFDRGAIEIRVMDLQECPAADVALAAFVSEVLKHLSLPNYISENNLMAWHHSDLRSIFDDVVDLAEKTVIHNKGYLAALAMSSESATVQDIWKHLFNLVSSSIDAEHYEILNSVIKNGSLSTRISAQLKTNKNHENVVFVYRQLAACLHSNQLFL